jgi:hypothetical protein
VELAHQMFDLARAGDAERLGAYVEAGVPVDLTDASGNTLLMLAAYHGHAATVAVLADRGADVTRQHRAIRSRARCSRPSEVVAALAAAPTRRRRRARETAAMPAPAGWQPAAAGARSIRGTAEDEPEASAATCQKGRDDLTTPHPDRPRPPVAAARRSCCRCSAAPPLRRAWTGAASGRRIPTVVVKTCRAAGSPSPPRAGPPGHVTVEIDVEATLDGFRRVYGRPGTGRPWFQPAAVTPA